MIAIPNMEKPKNITRCSYKINPEECKCIYTDKVFEETLALIMDHPCPDCPLIEIDLERDIPTIWYNRQTGQYEPKGTKQEVYERLYKLKNGERRAEQ